MAQAISTIVQQYLEVFPQEAAALGPLTEQLHTSGEERIADRTNFSSGHVTAGSIVISLPSKKILLIDHAALLKTLQPGGHVESEDASVLAAAYRECQEEAGLSSQILKYIPLSEQNHELPFAIRVHTIPANTARQEPAHRHYDFWYLFTVPDGTKAEASDQGVSNPQWVPFVAFAENTEFSQQAEKINKLLTTS